MTPQTFATILARFAGLWLVVLAVLQMPTLYNIATRPRLTDFPSFESRIPTDSPAYESSQRAQEKARETMARAEALTRHTSYFLYFSVGLHIVAGLLFIAYSREIGDVLCRGLDKKP